jgi:hypothetical protein
MPVNRLTRTYLDLAADGSPQRDAGRTARYSPKFHDAYGALMLPRPLLVEESVLRSAADDVSALYDLIASLPDRLFDGSQRRYCEAIGMPADVYRVMQPGATGRPPKHGRADLIFDGTGFRLLELNFGSELGGYDNSEANRALLEVDAFRAFAEEHRLSYVDTGDVIADLLRRIAEPVTGGTREPVVAVLERTGGFEQAPALYQSFQEVVTAKGPEILLGEVTQVVNKDGKLYLDGRPIDVVLRYFMLIPLSADPRAAELLEPILRAHHEGGTVLFAHLETTAYAYKDNLAFLSDERYRHAFSAEEAALIDRVVPWTRMLEPDLHEYCRAHREQLTIKPHAGAGAAGTRAGWQVSAEEWGALLAEATPGEYIVQRRVVPQHEPVLNPDTGELEEWVPIWGMFVTDRGYSGMWVRAQRSTGTAVIGYGTSAGFTSVFSYPK